MTEESKPRVESESKKHLLELEATGLYVFHGSDLKLEKLEPRQAYNVVKGERVDDDKPAVFAASSADMAIFMAIVNETNCPEGFESGYATNNEEITFKIDAQGARQITSESRGYVHVFDKGLFSRRGLHEVKTHQEVVPIEVVEVTGDDLPAYIIEEAST